MDAFLELFREIILGMKFFQKVKKDGVDSFMPVLNQMFQLNCTTPCFVPRPDETALKTALNRKFATFHRDVPTKVVSNAKPDGFTVSNLKYELSRLDLATTFPEIMDYAEAVYSEVDKRKKGSFLKTCELFDAVEQCQMNCILERRSELKKFVHNQKGCHRVYGFKCEGCAAEKSKIEKDQKLSILEKELSDLQIAHKNVFEEIRQKSLEIQELSSS
ncbi:unnamed protein product [Caenorhabditis nigoni]